MIEEENTSNVWLMIDTSLETHYFALWQNGVVWKLELAMKVSMEQIMEKLNSYLQDVPALSGVMLAIGPGSYTGLRFGYSLACGLAASKNVPLIGYSSFLAYSQPQASTLVLLDARAGGLYVGLVGDTGALLKEPLRWSKTWNEENLGFIKDENKIVWQSPEASLLQPQLDGWPTLNQAQWDPSRWILAYQKDIGIKDQFPFRNIRLEYLKQDSDVPTVRKT